MLIPVWAIFLSALFAFGVGALWYGPFFGRRWMDAVGMGLENGKLEVPVMGVTLAFWVASAFIYSYLLQLSGKPGMVFPFCLAFALWLGFAFPVRLLSVLYAKQSKSLIWIDGGYYLLGYGVLALMHVAFGDF